MYIVCGNGSRGDARPDLAEAARELNTPDSIQRDLETVDVVLDAYRRMNGGTNPPGGENDEIVAQLSGGKGKRLAVLSPDHPFIDPRGQLLDRWGTPFHFHPVSRILWRCALPVLTASCGLRTMSSRMGSFLRMAMGV